MLSCERCSVASQPISKLTEQEYLAIERAAESKSEFLDGEMFAMAGASSRHVLLQRNLLIEVHTAVRLHGRQAIGSDGRVRVSEHAYFYPDVSVFCGAVETTDQHDDNFINPVVIFEVLSPSTERYDRGVKFQRYRTIGSLTDLCPGKPGADAR